MSVRWCPLQAVSSKKGLAKPKAALGSVAGQEGGDGKSCCLCGTLNSKLSFI